MRTFGIVLTLLAAVAAANTALAQRDAGSKIRGEYNFYGGAASRSMRGAREYAQSYREYVRTAPQQKVEPAVAKEAADAIGEYITKAEKHFAWMRKQAQTAGDKETAMTIRNRVRTLTAAALLALTVGALGLAAPAAHAHPKATWLDPGPCYYRDANGILVHAKEGDTVQLGDGTFTCRDGRWSSDTQYLEDPVNGPALPGAKAGGGAAIRPGGWVINPR